MIKFFTNSGTEIKFKQSMFPVGENYVKIEGDYFPAIHAQKELTIKWIFNGDGEFLQLALLVNAIRAINKNIKLNLDIPYFPGARQDRVCENGEAFNLKVYAGLINSLNFEKVKVFDPHSDVTGALVDNIEIIDNSKFIDKCLTEEIFGFIGWTSKMVNGTDYDKSSPITLISPDAGANKKIFKLASKLPWKNIEVVRADKQRNTKTHEIIGTVVYGDVENKTVFVVDDIASRAGTFMALSKRLKEMKAARIILIVSHYEGTADINKLKESGIDKVYCYNDFNHLDPNDKEKFVEKIN